MLTVGLVGLGLTGSVIARFILEKRPDLRIVTAGAGPLSLKAGKDLGELVGLCPCDVIVSEAEDIPMALERARPQTVIDFSNADATLSLLDSYASIGCGVVVGTTGFSKNQLSTLQHEVNTQDFALMYAPNITRGVNVLMMIAKLVANYLPRYDIEVVERHHRRKKDSPSGTAAKIVSQLHEARGTARTLYGRHDKTPREDGEIGVHSLRAGGIVGVHEVMFASEFDEIVITHRAESRLAFAAGAVEAAEWIASRRGFYTIEDMIRDNDPNKPIPIPAKPLRIRSGHPIVV